MDVRVLILCGGPRVGFPGFEVLWLLSLCEFLFHHTCVCLLSTFRSFDVQSRADFNLWEFYSRSFYRVPEVVHCFLTSMSH